jgi:flagellin-like hook-associated protein FlgL
MVGIRVTQRSLATGVLGGLQNNIAKLGQTQNQLSTGKLITKASDSPGGTIAAMQYRGDITTLKQYGRNVSDGMGWLSTADSTLTSISSQVHRARDLILQGKSSGSYGTPQAREAVAMEIDNIRQAVLGQANTTYIDRPIFGGTTCRTPSTRTPRSSRATRAPSSARSARAPPSGSTSAPRTPSARAPRPCSRSWRTSPCTCGTIRRSSTTT